MNRKKIVVMAVTLGLLMATGANASPLPVHMYVDSGPNAYGSPAWPAWRDAAYAAVADGSFVNMASGYNPANIGSTDFEIQDEVVYSFGDLGRRLHWFYYVPGATIATLTGNFEVSLTNQWDSDPVDDFYFDYYGQTWLQPGSWIDYDANNDTVIDGVIGSGGMAWWGAYNTNTQAELDADIASWIQHDETWVFTARIRESGLDPWVEHDITSQRLAVAAVPEPASMALLGMGLAGLAAARIRRKRS